MTTKATPEQRILSQVEFYFSDSNLPRDNFLRTLVGKNEQGWVPIATLMTFKRMQQLCGDKHDAASVAAILRKSSEPLEVNEEGTEVRRTTPIPDKVDAKPRTVVVRGLPTDEDVAGLDELHDFFNQYGKVRAVRVRRENGKPNGQAFVEFATEEDAQKLATAEEVVFKVAAAAAGAESDEKKTEEEEAKKDEADSNNENSGGKLQAQMLADFYSEQKEKRKQQKKRKQGEGDDAKKEEEKPRETEKDVVLFFEGASDQTSREDLKETLKKYDFEVAYADFSRGDTSGFLRLKSGQSATKAVAALTEAKAKVKDSEVVWKVLEGEQEEAYWGVIRERMAASKAQRGRNKRRRRN